MRQIERNGKGDNGGKEGLLRERQPPQDAPRGGKKDHGHLAPSRRGKGGVFTRTKSPDVKPRVRTKGTDQTTSNHKV